MYPDERPKGMLEFSKKTRVLIKGAASAGLAYFAVRLFIGAAGDGGVNAAGTYFLWVCGALFAAGSIAGCLITIREARALLRQHTSAV